MTSRLFWLCALITGFCVSTPLVAGEPTSSPPPVAATQAVPPSPDAILQNGITSLTQKLKQGGSQAEIMAFLHQAIAPYFDFEYMARLSAGPYWNALSEAQRQTFEEQFQRTFFQALARQVANVGNPQIQFYPVRPGTAPNEVTVSARILQPQGMPILMDFRFYHSDQGWKVFDVVADGSSAVLYYRHFYADLVGRYGADSLLAAQSKPATP